MSVLLSLPTRLSVFALNKLIAKEEWAQQKIAQQSGKSIKLELGSFTAQYSLLSTGLVAQSDEAVVPNVTLTLTNEQFSTLIKNGVQDPSQLAHLLHIQGEAGLAQLVSELALNLRWDPEEYLSQVVGDVVAHKAVSATKYMAQQAYNSSTKVARTLSEFIAYEGKMVAAKPALKMLQEDIDDLAERISKLEQRFK